MISLGSLRPPRDRIARVVAVLASLGLAWAAGDWLSPSDSTTYLALQRRSDPLHRESIVLISAAGAGLLAGLLCRWCLRRRARWAHVGRAVALASLLLGVGALARARSFDTLIERRGFEGEWTRSASASATTSEPRSGPWSEDEPGVASDPLPDGDFITLDRISLARKRPDGTFRWRRPRPARSPAHLWVAGDEVLVVGPGRDFSDDMVATGVALEDGKERFAFHWLGDWLLTPALDGDALLICSVRPSSAVALLLRWTSAELAWRLPLPAPPDLPPRLDESGADLALHGEWWRIDRDTGQVLHRRNVCRPPTGEAACDGIRVRAWEPGEGP
jgi:hypothetical protein